MEKIKEMIKNKKNICIFFLGIILSYALTVLILDNKIVLSSIGTFDIWLFLLVTIFVFYILSHFLFPIKNLYNFIYNKRYVLAILIFAILVLGKFHGSSINMWQDQIEPNYNIESLEPLIGKARAIRSDEWLVNTSYMLSQTKNDFPYFNDKVRGTSTDMFVGLSLPVKDIMIVTRPFLIGYTLFGSEYGLSFYWYGRLIALFMITFEFFMIITKKNKLTSILGTFLVTFSAPVSWWYSNYIVEIILGGEFALIMFNNYLKEDNKLKKILYSLLIAFGCLIFVFTLYPAWIIPFAYIYVIMALYILYSQRENHKWKLKNFMYLGITILVILLFLIRFFLLSKDAMSSIMNTTYPGSRFEIGGNGYQSLFMYLYSTLFPYVDIGNPCENSTFLSFFPLPIILSIIYIIKNKRNWKDNLLIIGLTLVCILFSTFSFLQFPKILAKITLLYMVPVPRLNIATSFINVLLLILLLDKLNFKNKKIISFALYIIFIITMLYISNNIFPNYLTYKKELFLFILFTILGFLLIFLGKKYFAIGLILISLFMTVTINPFMKGINGLYEKPLANELNKYKDENATWLSLNSITVPNYLVLNGLKVINSTNLYPNLELWYKIDKDKKYEDIYNRYAHIEVNLTSEKTSFELEQPDYIKVFLEVRDLCTLNIDYVTANNLLEEQYDLVSFDKKYQNDNIYIYKVICEK